MPDPSRLRDSTQIVLPCGELEEVDPPVDAEFAVSVVATDDRCRIIGSPVEIKAVSEYLCRHGISLP